MSWYNDARFDAWLTTDNSEDDGPECSHCKDIMQLAEDADENGKYSFWVCPSCTEEEKKQNENNERSEQKDQ
jgi:hypothetical protein